jgi:predicted glutamate--cysteine ligase
VRCEAALLLALSASSPFLNRQITGTHSQRWLQFPLTPKQVPLFRDLEHFVEWTDIQLVEGRMHNVRHLWTSVRPNGPQRPFDLNRLELRICDLVTNPDLLLAITALMELRVLMLLREPEQLDPFKASDLSADQLMVLSDRNDAAAARHSLDAQLHDWRDGRQRLCRDWLKDMINAVMPAAHELGLASCLLPLEVVLAEGNQAMRWLKGIESGRSLEEEFRTGILEMEQEEQPVDRFLADALG